LLFILDSSSPSGDCMLCGKRW